jgi:hypothetical protein
MAALSRRAVPVIHWGNGRTPSYRTSNRIVIPNAALTASPPSRGVATLCALRAFGLSMAPTTCYLMTSGGNASVSTSGTTNAITKWSIVTMTA